MPTQTTAIGALLGLFAGLLAFLTARKARLARRTP